MRGPHVTYYLSFDGGKHEHKNCIHQQRSIVENGQCSGERADLPGERGIALRADRWITQSNLLTQSPGLPTLEPLRFQHKSGLKSKDKLICLPPEGRLGRAGC